MGQERQVAFRSNEEQTIPLTQRHPVCETKKQSQPFRFNKASRRHQNLEVQEQENSGKQTENLSGFHELAMNSKKRMRRFQDLKNGACQSHMM